MYALWNKGPDSSSFLLLSGLIPSYPIIDEMLEPSLKKLPGANDDLFSLKFWSLTRLILLSWVFGFIWDGGIEPSRRFIYWLIVFFLKLGVFTYYTSYFFWGIYIADYTQSGSPLSFYTFFYFFTYDLNLSVVLPFIFLFFLPSFFIFYW